MFSMSLNFTDVFLLRLCLETVFAGFIAAAFAMLFQVPVRYLKLVALGGAVTRFLRTLLFAGMGIEVVIATFIACSITSLLFIYIAPKLNVPRPVFTVASIIPLIPGMDAYTSLLAMANVIEIGNNAASISENIYLVLHHGMRCFGIMLSISLGIAVPPLLFYRYRHGKK